MKGKSQTTRLTRRTVEAAQSDEARELRIWDSELKGFHLRVWPTGRKVYCLRYRAGARQRSITIGVHGSPWKADTARSEAFRLLAEISAGADPLMARQELRQATTVAELIDLYLDEGPKQLPNKRASSWATDRTNLERHVRPLLGLRHVRDLRPPDISRWQSDVASGKTARNDNGRRKRGRTRVRGGRGAAGRAMCTLAAMLAWAVRNGQITRSPADRDSGVQKIKSRMRERFLSAQEARNLQAAIDRLERERPKGLKPRGRVYGETAQPGIPRDHADAIRLLMLTGARRGEILGLRWNEVDLERGLIVLAPERHKGGGSGRVRPIALPHHAVSILCRMTRRSAYVFPDSSGVAPITDLKRSWPKVLAEANLPGLRIHDLRHTFASFAVAAGAPLYLVGKALGHTKASTTERYAHLRPEALHGIADRVAMNWTTDA